MADQEILDSLTEAVSGVLEAECTIDDVLKFTSTGSDLGLDLKRQAVDLGWLGIAAPEAAGGGDMGIAALVPIYHELGRHLAPLPFIGQQLCTDALAASGHDGDDRIAALIAGEVWGAAAPSFSFNAARIGADGTLDAAPMPIFDDGSSSHLLLFAREADGTPVALLLDIAGGNREHVAMHDHTRPVSTLALMGRAVSAGERLASGDAALALQTRSTDHQSLALAADCVGGSREALARTVEYLKVRQQFGRPIGSFQALKHRAATMKLDMETSAALVRAAASEFGSGSHGSALASLAKARACTAYVKIAGEAIQLHGGIGFTRECPVHLHLKRAKMNQSLDNGDRSALDRAAALLVKEAA